MDQVQQLRTLEHPPRVLQQLAQQAELDGGQREALGLPQDPLPGLVDGEAAGRRHP